MSRPPPTAKPDAHPHGARHARLGRIHDRILDAYGRVTAGAPADRSLQQVIKKARDLGSRERAEVGDVVYGLLRTQRRIDDRIERAARAEKRRLDTLDAPMMNRVRVLAYLAEQGVEPETLAATDPAGFKRLPGVIARIAQGRLPKSKKKGVEALAVDLCFQTWMTQRLVDAFGEERTRAIGAGLDGRGPVTLRLSAAVERDEIAERIRNEQGVGVAATKLAPRGLVLPHPVDLPSWPLFKEGAIDLQDEGSQLVALACGVRAGESVLDACAGAGGKTLALANSAPTAKIVAMDPDAGKLEELKRRLAAGGSTRRANEATESQGRPGSAGPEPAASDALTAGGPRRSASDADRRESLENPKQAVSEANRTGRHDAVSVVKGDLTQLPSALHGAFDVVLVDAPCTASGTMRRHPDLRWRLKSADVDREASRQRRLLAGALLAVKPGGRLIYATCSVFAEENEAIAAYLVAQESRLAPLPLATLWGARLSEQLAATHEARIGPGPSRDGPDGFYVAAFRRRA